MMSREKELVAEIFVRHPSLRTRGFLPAKDPLTNFPAGSPYEELDSVGRSLPEALKAKDFRRWVKNLDIPLFSMPSQLDDNGLRELQLYYVRIAFLASGYIHQVTTATQDNRSKVNVLPKNIARALTHAAYHLVRPPILSYDGYALYNWRRIDPNGPIALGNIDTFQNFVDMYDEHWFILVHVEIEAIAGTQIMPALELYAQGAIGVDECLCRLFSAVEKMVAVLRRIPEHMDPAHYANTFRHYIEPFEKIVYEGVSNTPRDYRGETGAQSSIMPLLQSFLKIKHNPTGLTKHLQEMRSYMPVEHVILLEAFDKLPSIQDEASKNAFNDVLDKMAEFRTVHYSWAKLYIPASKVGTGKTEFHKWLPQLRDETLAEKKK